MATGTSNDMETSIYSMCIEFESVEIEDWINGQVSNQILNVSGVPSSYKSIKSIPQPFDQTATTSVIDAICFPPFESQSTVVTGKFFQEFNSHSIIFQIFILRATNIY